MRLRLRPVFAFIAITGSAIGVEVTDTVTIRDFTLVPLGNLAYRHNRLVMHPKAMIGAGYNSNVYATPDDEIADTYGEAIAGIEASYQIGVSQRVDVDVEGEGRAYLEETSRDLVGGRARARYELEDSQGMTYQASAGYARYDDPLIESGQQITRGAGSMGAMAGWQGSRNRLSLRGEWQNENFFEAGPGFGEDERDSDTVRTALVYGHGTGEEGEIFAKIMADTHRYAEYSDQFQDSTGVAGLVGWQLTVATRIAMHVEAGVEHRAYDEISSDDPAYADDITAVIGAASLRWNWEAGSYVDVRAYRSITSSVSSNAAFLTGVDGDLRYRLREKTALVSGGKVYLLEQSGAATGQVVEKRGTGQARAGVEYLVRDGVGFRLVGTYEISKSRTENDYDRVSVLLSFGFAY